MTENEFQQKQSEMSDMELIEKAQNEVSKLCETGGKSLRMTVPPSVNDTDMLLCELINRFKSKL